MKKLARSLSPTKEAAKYLSGLQAKQYKQVVRRIMGLLEDPEPHDSKPLQGAEYEKVGLRRVDEGEYRIVYAYSAELVEIYVVGPRNDGKVYKDLKGKTL